LSSPGQFRRAYTSHPITSFAGWDTVYELLSVLRQLEMGQFRQAAMLADAFGRSARIDAVLRTRVGAIMAAGLDIKPANDRRVSIKAAEMLGGLEDGPGQWDRIFPLGVQSQILRSGMCLNFGLAEILWTSEGGMWWPRLKFWHSQFVRWDGQLNTYILQTQDGDVVLPRRDENPIGDGKWFIWCPFGYQNAWLHGMVRGLTNVYMRLMWNDRDWPRHNEVNGQPVRKAKVPNKGNLADANEDFFQAVANYHSEATIMAPQGLTPADSYDVELIEATARVWESFKDAKTDANTDAAVLVLGQNLTTEATGGGLGDGGASIQNLVRMDKAEEDAAIATAFRDQVLIPWAQFNFGDGEAAPLPVYKVRPPEDGLKKAQQLKATGDAIAANKAAGVPINIRATAEAMGVILVSEEEQAALELKLAEEQKAQAEKDATEAAKFGGPKRPDGLQGKDDEKPAALRAKIARRSFVATNAVERYEFAGLPVAVEYQAGTVRELTDDEGNPIGTVNMTADYGFLEGYLGSDGDELDVYIGPDEAAANVYVIHQLRAPDFKVHDEDKAILGVGSEAEARALYLAHRGVDGEQAIGGVSVIPIERFKAKLQRRRGGGSIRA